MDKHSGLPADVADAGLVALANRLNGFCVVTIDNDLTIYRGAAKQSFEIVVSYPLNRGGW